MLAEKFNGASDILVTLLLVFYHLPLMRIHTFFFTLAVVLACGCATEHFTKSYGDAGQFILQQTIRY
ncbi:MAG: hypothetical protein WBS33_17495 [Verrucomicrobiia bacterium]